MLKEKDMQLSIHSLLYDKIPENHTLKLINDNVEFSFINRLLEKSYFKYYGRPAKEPELMVKILVLQKLYNLSDEQVIEDASLHLAYMYDSAYVDGTQFNELIEITKESGVTINEVFGDRAYFKKPILDKIKELEATAYIPVNPMTYKVNEDRFSYNKDSDEWFCVQGKKYAKKKDRNGSYKYYFEKEKCRNCPLRESCVSGTAVRKILVVGLNTPEFYEYSQREKTEEFKEKYKKRACQEWKNWEIKNFHGLDRARGTV